MIGFTHVAACAAAMLLCVSGAAQAEGLPVSGTTFAATPVPLDAGLMDPGAEKKPFEFDISTHQLSVPSPDTGTAKALTGSLPDLVSAHMQIGVPDAEHECLAGAIYFEAKGEPLQGQLAVAEVILNRVKSGRYPPSICGVVKQKHQFSFVRGGRIPPVARSSEAWRRAVAVAHVAKGDLADGGVGDAMFFHANYVSPAWRRLTRVASIGNHIFYRY